MKMTGEYTLSFGYPLTLLTSDESLPGLGGGFGHSPYEIGHFTLAEVCNIEQRKSFMHNYIYNICIVEGLTLSTRSGPSLFPHHIHSESMAAFVESSASSPYRALPDADKRLR
nr:hypothetical protein Q903MT_gene3359 [Picea sitchensis]